MAAGLMEPRRASERGLAKGCWRPAERRFTVGGSSKSVARCHRSVLAYWKFESISLQQTVRLSPGFASVRGKARVFSHYADHAGWQLSAFVFEPVFANQHGVGVPAPLTHQRRAGLQTDPEIAAWGAFLELCR